MDRKNAKRSPRLPNRPSLWKSTSEDGIQVHVQIERIGRIDDQTGKQVQVAEPAGHGRKDDGERNE
jgi:hypothetical protein